jgi:hypothetical protein
MSTAHYQELLNDATDPNHTEEQKAFFEALLGEVKEKRLTMNQAYNKACGGYLSFNGEGDEKPKGQFKGTFNLWLDNAIKNGWISQANTIVEGAKDKFGNDAKQIQHQDEVDARMEKDFKAPKKNTYIGIGIAIAIIGITAYVIYKNKQKD